MVRNIYTFLYSYEKKVSTAIMFHFITFTIPNIAETSKSNRCELEFDRGGCEADMPRYYYDKVTNTCNKFTYGGCGGNANRFYNLTECQDVCQGRLKSIYLM